MIGSSQRASLHESDLAPALLPTSCQERLPRADSPYETSAKRLPEPCVGSRLLASRRCESPQPKAEQAQPEAEGKNLDHGAAQHCHPE
jgi:hypothetical protein